MNKKISKYSQILYNISDKKNIVIPLLNEENISWNPAKRIKIKMR